MSCPLVSNFNPFWEHSWCAIEALWWSFASYDLEQKGSDDGNWPGQKNGLCLCNVHLFIHFLYTPEPCVSATLPGMGPLHIENLSLSSPGEEQTDKLIIVREGKYFGILVWSSCCNKIPWTEWLKEQTFLTVLEAGEWEIKLLVDSISGEGPLPGLQMAAFLMCLQTAGKSEPWFLFFL